MTSSTHALRTAFPATLRFEGHAIVSADGMIAADDGSVPAVLHNDVDWELFQAALSQSALVVLGRLGHKRHPNSGRRRLVFTGGVATTSTDPADSLATYFNPAGMPLAGVLDRLGLIRGTVAVTGGTRIFDYFLPLYDRFVLTEVQEAALPTGRPCFSDGHPRTELAAAGMRPAGFELIDPGARVTRTRWER